MRTRPFALGVGFVLAVSGCTVDDASARPAPPPVQVARAPAASVGGACVLWDYARIEQALGVRFEVAGAGRVDDTSTCVVQTQGADRPDLLLAAVEPTGADPALFTANQAPANATTIEGLGAAAYRVVVGSGAGEGPVAEVSWLSADARVTTLRFRFPAGATAADADDMANRLVTLARDLADDR